MLQNYKHSVGMTLFSQVLEDTKNVIRDLSAISKKFTLLLFTDGCVTDRGLETVELKSKISTKI